LAASGPAKAAYQASLASREHIARVGVNYHFGTPMVAKY
jgi:hypothetical protein